MFQVSWQKSLKRSKMLVGIEMNTKSDISLLFHAFSEYLGNSVYQDLETLGMKISVIKMSLLALSTEKWRKDPRQG